MTVLLRENLIQLFDEVLHFVTLCYTLLNTLLHTIHCVTLCYTVLRRQNLIQLSYELSIVCFICGRHGEFISRWKSVELMEGDLRNISMI